MSETAPDNADTSGSPQRRGRLAGAKAFFEESFRDWRKRLVGYAITVVILLALGVAVAAFGFRHQLEGAVQERLCTRDWAALLCNAIGADQPAQAPERTDPVQAETAPSQDDAQTSPTHDILEIPDAMHNTIERSRAAAAIARTIARRAANSVQEGRRAASLARANAEGYASLASSDECEWFGEAPMAETTPVHGELNCPGGRFFGRFYLALDRRSEINAWRADFFRIEYLQGSSLTSDTTLEFAVIIHEGRTFAGELRHDGTPRFGELQLGGRRVYRGELLPLPSGLTVEPEEIPAWLTLLTRRHGLGAEWDNTNALIYAGPWYHDQHAAN